MLLDPPPASSSRRTTYADVMIQTLPEASGQPPGVVRSRFAAIRLFLPPSRSLGAVLPDAEADELLAKLRGELQGILNWLLKGASAAESHRRAL